MKNGQERENIRCAEKMRTHFILKKIYFNAHALYS